VRGDLRERLVVTLLRLCALRIFERNCFQPAVPTEHEGESAGPQHHAGLPGFQVREESAQEQQAIMRRLSFEGQIYGAFIDCTTGRNAEPRRQSIIKLLGDWHCVVQAVGPEIGLVPKYLFLSGSSSLEIPSGLTTSKI
jgi:hypothetical protein